MTNIDANSTISDSDEHDAEEPDSERLELIQEIQRLEKSMNVALRVNRDEIERLTNASSEKEEMVRRMEEELADLTAKLDGGETDTEGGGGGETTLPASLSSIGGTRRRRASVSGGGVRGGIAGLPQLFGRQTPESHVRSCSDTDVVGNLNFLDDDENNEGADNDVGEEHDGYSKMSNAKSEHEPKESLSAAVVKEIEKYTNILEEKEQELEKFQQQRLTNQKKLSLLMITLSQYRHESHTQRENHMQTMAELQKRKEDANLQIAKNRKSINDAQTKLEEYNTRILPELERNIAMQKELPQKLNQPTPRENSLKQSNVTIRDIESVEDEVKKYHLKLQLHSMYTEKALQSFISIMEKAEKKIPVDGREDGAMDEEEHDQFIQQIAVDIDIELNNLERMIKSVEEKAKEFTILSSPVDARRSSNGDNITASSSETNKLVYLTKQSADIITEFTESISKIAASTIRPRSTSIDFSRATVISTTNTNAGGNSIESDDITDRQIQHKREKLQHLQQTQQDYENRLQTLRREIDEKRASAEEESRSNHEIFAKLQTRVKSLTNRLMEGGEEIGILIEEIEKWKDKERALLRRLHRDRDSESDSAEK